MDICRMLGVTLETPFDVPVVCGKKLRKALGMSPDGAANYISERIRALNLVADQDYRRLEVRDKTGTLRVQYLLTLRACGRIMQTVKRVHARLVAQIFMDMFPELGNQVATESTEELMASESEPMPYYSGQYDPMTNRCVSLEPMAVRQPSEAQFVTDFTAYQAQDNVWLPGPLKDEVQAADAEPTIIQEETEMQAVEPEVIEEPTMALTLWEAVKQSIVTHEDPFPVTDDMLTGYFEVDDDHRVEWLIRKLDQLPYCLENVDYRISRTTAGKSGRGRPKTRYHFSREMAKHMGLIDRSAKGHELRKKIIEIEEQFTQAVQTGAGQLETVMANVLGQVQQGTLTVLAKLEEYKHEDRMAAAKAEDRFVGLIEAYRATTDRLTTLVERLAEKPMAEPQPEAKPTPKPTGLVRLYNWLMAHCKRVARDVREEFYARCKVKAKEHNRKWEEASEPGLNFPVFYTEAEVATHVAKQMNILKVA